jgi:hypothetical protein
MRTKSNCDETGWHALIYLGRGPLNILRTPLVIVGTSYPYIRVFLNEVKNPLALALPLMMRSNHYTLLPAAITMFTMTIKWKPSLQGWILSRSIQPWQSPTYGVLALSQSSQDSAAIISGYIRLINCIILMNNYQGGITLSKLFKLLAISIIICVSTPLFASDLSSPKAIIYEYVDAILDEDWEKAQDIWLKSEIDKSQRLNIGYLDMPAKYDCASTLVNNRLAIKSGLLSLSVSESVDCGGYQTTNIILSSSSDTVTIPYHTILKNGKYKIFSALNIHTFTRNTIDTKYTRVHYWFDNPINDFALDDLDRFIEQAGISLDISNDKMELLEREKIDYYLCTENEFEQLTGYNAHGIANLQFDAIVSQHLPHQHELTHLLINYALGELPLYTLPILQEGLAVAVGGRWGKDPKVVMQIGPVVIKNGICNLEDILTFNGFHNEVGMPDISYPVSAIFVDMLIKEFGIDKFKDLYLDLSGSSYWIQSLTRDDIKAIIEKHTGHNWDSVKTMFEKYWPLFEFSGIIPGGDLSADQPLYDNKAGNLRVQMWDSEDYYQFKVLSDDEPPRGVILIADANESMHPEYQSWMFAEHLPDDKYQGQKYGIQFTPDEVGLYDYITNILEAKYIASFSPSSDYWNVDDKTISFRLKKDALAKMLWEYNIEIK